MNEKQFDHLFLLGHIGAGKTLHAKRLQKPLHMFSFSIDIFRFVKTKEELLEEIRELKEKIEYESLPKKYPDSAYAKRLQSDVEAHKQQLDEALYSLKLRELAPNARNFYELGYDEDFAKHVYFKFGKVNGLKLVHLYKQLFIYKMTAEIIEDLKEPCIIDTSGGEFINFDYSRELAIITKSYCKANGIILDENNVPEEIVKILQLSQGKEYIQEKEISFASLKAIGNIVLFKQDENLFKENNKASEDKTNEILAQKKYRNELLELNPLTIDTSGLFDNQNGSDQERIERNINKIIKYYNRSK